MKRPMLWLLVLALCTVFLVQPVLILRGTRGGFGAGNGDVPQETA